MLWTLLERSGSNMLIFLYCVVLGNSKPLIGSDKENKPNELLHIPVNIVITRKENGFSKQYLHRVCPGC